MPTKQQVDFYLASPKSIPQSAFTIVPSDTVNLEHVSTGLHVGISGNDSDDVTVETLEGNTVTFLNVLQGTRLETGAITKVLNSGTSASGLVAYYYVTIQPPQS